MIQVQYILVFIQMAKIPAIIAKKATTPPFVAKEIAPDEVVGVEAEVDSEELEGAEVVAEPDFEAVAETPAEEEPEEAPEETADSVVEDELPLLADSVGIELNGIELSVVGEAVGAIVVTLLVHCALCIACALWMSWGVQWRVRQLPASAWNCALPHTQARSVIVQLSTAAAPEMHSKAQELRFRPPTPP